MKLALSLCVCAGLVAAASASSASYPQPEAMGAVLEPAKLAALAHQCGADVDPTTVMAIIAYESAGKPFSVAINATKALPAESSAYATAEEATVRAEIAISHGRSVDLGLMMINSANLPTLDIPVKELFDPCRNIGIGANLLHQAFDQEQRKLAEAGTADADGQLALARSLSRYNTGNADAGLVNGYVAKVKVKAVPAITARMPTTSQAQDSSPVDPLTEAQAAMQADMDIPTPGDGGVAAAAAKDDR